MLENEHRLTVHQLIEYQVAQTPDLVAVIFGERQLTYQELNQKANQLAHYLTKLGVKPEVLVGVCIERSLEMIIALLGILKAGGAYVPLDPTYPVERLQYMLEDTQTQILLTQSHLDNPSKQRITAFCLDTQWELIANQACINPPSKVNPDNLAYVIYTSGSTGNPKGVSMPHHPLLNLLEWQSQQIPVKPGSRTLQYTPISFDVSFQEIFSTLAAGGTLVLILEDLRRNPSSLLKLLKESEIERLFLPFVALRQLAEVSQLEGTVPSSLKEVITAGEQLRITPAIVHWFTQMPQCTLHNHYGPSETHVVTAFTLIGSPQEWSVLPSIGRPITNTQIYLLDAQLKPVPEGVSGELYLGGDCLARGYLNRPDLTAERFIVNPFHHQPGERLYKTGDLARYLPDGNLEYLGRIDQQVKIRGYRVEPGELEAILEKHPQVKQAVVIARNGMPNDKREHFLGDMRLAAYVVPKAQAIGKEPFTVPFSRELQQFLRVQVPGYMVPSAFVVLDEFPLTPSGKVDRRALPIPQWSRIEEGSYVSPQTPLETKLAKIWSQLLEVEQIGIHDVFCELGGHSLLAVQLVAQVSEAFQLKIPLESFLEGPTIARLANTINALLQSENATESSNSSDLQIELDPTISPQNILTDPIPNIFLTGVTGFLGGFLLYELLQQTRSDIYCLVRATSPEQGRSRIERTLKRSLIWDENFGDRIIPVIGDLGDPNLGLPPEQFSRLAEKLDVIYHCGARVNVVYPYSVLKGCNVLGTQEVLRLASQTKIKPVHFVSTVDVFSSGENTEIRTITEADEIGPIEHLYEGYPQSKYLAEKLVMEASSRGLPICIYRPANIGGHSKTGIGQTTTMNALIIKACIEIGLFPKIEASVNLTPVDYVSKAIVHISLQPKGCDRAFNIVNPKGLDWQQVGHYINKLGYPVKQVTYETWYKELVKHTANNTGNVLAPLVSIFANQKFIQKTLGAFHFDCPTISDELTRHNIVCPSINEDLLASYFEYLNQQGFLKKTLFPKESTSSKNPLN
jgi:amino acid adenylation domain-containing protein/thioester reductase-like protein